MPRRLSICLLLCSLSLLLPAKTIGPKQVPQLVADYEKQMAEGNLVSAYRLVLRVDSIWREQNEAGRSKLSVQGYAHLRTQAALEQIGELALDRADSIGTEAAYNEYLKTFKKVPRKLRTEAEMLRSASVGGQMYADRYAALDAAWLEEHKQAVATGLIEDLDAFVRSHSYRTHPEFKARDYALTREPLPSDTAALITLAAPYRLAYRLLIEHLNRRYRGWQTDPSLRPAAAVEVRRYAEAFGTDPTYRDLLRLLDYTAGDYTPSLLFPDLQPGQMYCPVLSGDDRTLYFCGRGLALNLAPGQEDIFSSVLTDDGWAAPVPVGALNNAVSNDAIESISTDGTEVFVFIDGQTYTTRKTAEGWGKLRPWSESINRLSTWVSDVHMTADGTAALFAMETPGLRNPLGGGHKPRDIYVTSRLADGTWSAPLPLGDDINTPFSDRMPYLHPDMQTLYFTSEGHSSVGGYDVFRSRRLDPNRWDRWSAPENLGLMVNTPGDETFFHVSTSGTTLYLASGPREHLRLMSLTLPPSMQPDPVVTLSGTLLTDKGLPVGASIRWEDLTTGDSIGLASTDPADGSFFLTLRPGHLYGYYVDQAGYLPASDYVDLSEMTSSAPIRKDIVVRSLVDMVAAKQSLEIHNLFFALDKVEILPASMPELRRMASLIKLANTHVEIGGHADSSGSSAHNQALSEARAKAVREVLIAEGCDPAMISAVGYGSTRPLTSNDTEEGRARNRRVEITFR